MGTDAGVCSACGSQIRGQLPGGVCAACLVALALEADEPAAPPAYRLLTVLAADEFRTTYLGQQEGTSSLVAVDVVRGHDSDGTRRELFDQQVKTLVSLGHPSMARVLSGRITAAGDYCIVTQYSPGPTAETAAAVLGLTGADVAGVFDQVCDAVEYAHAREVVHGRLQPSSVVIRRGAGALLVKVTGYSACGTRAVEADDIAGLGRILSALTASPELAAQFAPVILRATGRSSPAFLSVASLREAALHLRKGDPGLVNTATVALTPGTGAGVE